MSALLNQITLHMVLILGYRYPGARVDSESPFYQLSIEEVWKDWVWTERFPCRDEVCEYYQHVERTLGIKKNIRFNSRVVSARFDDASSRWVITTKDSFVVHPRFFILAIGAASKPHTPPFADFQSFKGICVHTASWPEGLVTKGKRVAVIGTGASGVQVPISLSLHSFINSVVIDLCVCRLSKVSVQK